MLKAAVIGVGSMGRNHARLIIAQDTNTAPQGLLSISMEDFYHDPARCTVKVVT